MQQANHFQMHNLALKVTYFASGIDGKPHFSYEKGRTERSFKGDDILREETAIGTLLSVRLKGTADSKSVYFSVLLPHVNVPEGIREVQVNLRAFETTVRTSIGGPSLVKGQVQTYKGYLLRGKASAVLF